jgi:hypothetical protein
MAASTALPIDSALAQGVKRTSTATGGASRNIILRAVVRPFCKLSKVHHGIRLRGKTDGGASIDSTIGSEGGFTVICNKPYAMNLERHPVFGPPSDRPKRRRAEATDPFDFDPDRLPVYGTPDLLIERRRVATSNPNEAFALARGGSDVDEENADETIVERDYEVVLSVESIDQPMQATCVMAASASPFVCHAFDGPESAKLPLPRLDARLMVTGSTERSPDVASAAGNIIPQILLLQQHRDAAADDTDTAERLLARDSVVRRRRIGDALTVSVTARY